MKKVLCMLLCLCMMIGILPTTLVANAQTDSKTMTFGYAYDVQRNPAFPTKKGDKVTVSGFQTPLRYGASASGSMIRYENSAGTWTLTEVGTFGNISKVSPAPTSNLKPIVKTVAESCGISDMNSIVIHKLTGINNNLVGYGVVLCIDEDNGQALFLADLFNQSGAGFFLSKSEVKSKSVTITADKITQASTEKSENSDVSSDAKPVEALNFTIDEPYAWETAAKKATVEQSSQVEVTDVKWNGTMWNPDGSFMQNASYTVDITVRIKSGSNMYFDKNKLRIKINGESGAEAVEISGDKKQAVIRGYYDYLKSKDQAALEEKKQEEAKANRKGTAVSKFEPGDYGTARFKDRLNVHLEPKTGSKVESMSDYSYLDAQANLITIVEAYVPSINRENEFFHVIKYPDYDGGIGYVPADDKIFDCYREGNNAKRPYYEKWKGKIKFGDPIEKINTYALSFPNGIPTYGFKGSDEEKKSNFYVEKIVFEHPEGVKPFMYTSAVVTYKARDGYYFDKNIKFDEYRDAAEHTTGHKIIDNKTMEVYLTAFTWDMGMDAGATDAMIAFKKTMDNRMLLPVAVAEFNFPLFDYWDLKLKRRDFEFNEHYVNKFIEKNMRTEYVYPTTDAYVETTDANGHFDMVKNEHEYPSNYTISRVEIADLDVSDEIPGLVGEWALLTNGRYIPKSCLKNIRFEDTFKGAPAEFVVSPFEFAGGSGTIDDPYLIETAEQLNAVRQGPKNHYKLIADIDLSNWGNWVPIGGTPAYGFMGGGWNKAENYACSFQGSFDGNGHVVSGMTIVINENTPFMTETGNWRAYGLFANLASSPEEYKIKNLGVVDFTIDVTYTDIKKNLDLYAGAICGGMNSGTDIYNCYSKGGKIKFNVTANEEEANRPINAENLDGAPHVNLRIGGICADAGSAPGHRLHLEKCFNDSDISVNITHADKNLYVGGIVGAIDTTHIHECYNSGNITLPVDEGDLMGSWHESIGAGICAFASIPEIPGIYHKPPESASFIQNCYNSGNITARAAAGIFVYSASDIHFENCYNTGTVTGNVSDTNSGYSASDALIPVTAVVTQYGSEYIRNCYTNGSSVSGAAWKNSSALGRKVLAAISEDNPPSIAYNFKPSFVGKFNDVSAGSWYASPVRWAVQSEVTSGTSEVTFSPDTTCTRAQILTFMWRAAGSPSAIIENPFTDVKVTDYYYKAALWAYSKGMVSETLFAGDTPCTRSATVVYLWKNADSPATSYSGNFSDVSDSSDYAQAVAWAVENGVTSGTSETTFSPDTTCTRGQIVTFLKRALR